MELREYQKDLLDRLFQAYHDGYQAPCIVLPCGGGKSVIIAEAARRFTENGRQVLFLVHRKELCAQITKTFIHAGVQMEFCRIMMVQTMVRRLKKAACPDLIITDENHHSLAATYKKIYRAFPQAKRLGVTATPERLDGSGLKDVNDILIEGVNAQWLMEHDYLSPYDYYAPNIRLPKFHIRQGDFDLAEMNGYFRQHLPQIYGDVLAHYRRLADGKQAICYLSGVEVSRQTAALFTESGIPSAHIDGGTPKEERDRLIHAFRTGRIRILCNVDIISEGFDVPDCECVILLRPTKSLTLYIQQSMRCMRYRPGKRAVIIDHVNNIHTHGFPDAQRQWLLEGHPKTKGTGTAPVKCCGQCYACVPANTKICPHCGYTFEAASRAAKEDLSHKLVKVNTAENRVRFYLTPNECQTVEELKIYAACHGYKPGWVWYQQKARGWFHDEQSRNSTAKRYPCRPVRGWHCAEK